MNEQHLREMNRKIVDSMKKSSYEVLHALDESTIDAVGRNKSLLRRILSDNRDTEYGKKYNFKAIESIEDFKNTVPFTIYDDYEEYIERMTDQGEGNLLTAYPVVYYASTSGTSGSPKKIPVTDRGLAVFRSYASAVMPAVISEFYKDTRYEDTPVGFRMMIVSFSKHPLPCGVDFGSISAACMTEKTLEYLPYITSTPREVMLCRDYADLKYLHARYGLAEREIVYLTGAYIPALLDILDYIKENWEMLVEDIREGKINAAVTMPETLRHTLEERLSPDPERADELEREFKKGSDSTLMRRIWPNLSAVSAIWAGNFSSYARRIQNRFTGRSIPYYTMSYASSEGIFAVARHPFDQCYCMIPESCFFEFIPMDGRGAGEEKENPETLLIDEVEEGKEYELVITNQSGFYRYRMGDVIKVIGFYNESPLIVFKYRKKNIVSIAGEKFTEDHLLSAIKEFERRSEINVIDFCMYPDRESVPGRYVILIEPEEVVSKERLDECTDILSEELERASTSYAHYIAGGNMGKAKIIFLQQQVFQLHREIKMYKMGLTENQLKTARVLNTPELIKFFTSQAEPY